MGVFRCLLLRLGSAARARRAEKLRRLVRIEPHHRVLDLGGGDGSHFRLAFPEHENVVVADHDRDALGRATSKYGFETFLIDATDTLPFSDLEFDFVFCSSVIEHVTGPKADVWEISDDAFEAIAKEKQKIFASEIRRISLRYYVQTPNKWFLIEPHSYLPGFIVLFPRRILVNIFRHCHRFWITNPCPDWRLLTAKELGELFPDARIERERVMFLTKSLMALRA